MPGTACALAPALVVALIVALIVPLVGPYLDGAVLGARRHLVPIGAPVQSIDLIRMAGQSVHRLLGLMAVPELERRVRRAAHQHAGVGAPHHLVDLADVADQSLQERAWRARGA